MKHIIGILVEKGMCKRERETATLWKSNGEGLFVLRSSPVTIDEPYTVPYED